MGSIGFKITRLMAYKWGQSDIIIESIQQKNEQKINSFILREVFTKKSKKGITMW